MQRYSGSLSITFDCGVMVAAWLSRQEPLAITATSRTKAEIPTSGMCATRTAWKMSGKQIVVHAMLIAGPALDLLHSTATRASFTTTCSQSQAPSAWNSAEMLRTTGCTSAMTETQRMGMGALRTAKLRERMFALVGLPTAETLARRPAGIAGEPTKLAMTATLKAEMDARSTAPSKQGTPAPAAATEEETCAMKLAEMDFAIQLPTDAISQEQLALPTMTAVIQLAR
mmetsp:Transcript_19784/g.14518  ORF Transcript_19784/g.14518 Transcript_19784/m.14518 type:complete len:228 (-) Transcript_19784:884-1567(-)